jgi:hypothetical protein
MRSFLAARTASQQGRIHPALRSFAGSCGDTAMKLLAYIGGLALLAIIMVLFANPLTHAAVEASGAGTAKPGFSPAARSYPAFAVSQFDLAGKSETYEILRHPQGGRKDVLRWAGADERPVAELEIYRPGQESPSQPPAADLAARIDPDATREIESAGVIDSKFGAVTLLSLPDRSGKASACLGFLKSIAEPSLRISGWSCQGDGLPARRAAIGCMLSRLVLLSAGNDPKLADLFARAELRRRGCPGAGAAAASAAADWVNGAQNPRLRGSL